MPKIGEYKESHELPCSRCKSKRKVQKKWTEKVKNSSGFMMIEHTRIICTDKKCQIDFDKMLIEEEKKREKQKLARKNPPTAVAQK